jgi:hypothetical protein
MVAPINASPVFESFTIPLSVTGCCAQSQKVEITNRIASIYFFKLQSIIAQ